MATQYYPYNYCLRLVKSHPQFPDGWGVFNEVKRILTKLDYKVSPCCNQRTLWFSSNRKVPDLSRGILSDLVEDMVESNVKLPETEIL